MVLHLFFADDSMIFGRASRGEINTVGDILALYEKTSGQKINFEKSEVAFSSNVSQDANVALKNILGVRQVDRHAKYLGIPTTITRSKKLLFQDIIDREFNRIIFIINDTLRRLHIFSIDYDRSH